MKEVRIFLKRAKVLKATTFFKKLKNNSNTLEKIHLVVSLGNCAFEVQRNSVRYPWLGDL